MGSLVIISFLKKKKSLLRTVHGLEMVKKKFFLKVTCIGNLLNLYTCKVDELTTCLSSICAIEHAYNLPTNVNNEVLRRRKLPGNLKKFCISEVRWTDQITHV